MGNKPAPKRIVRYLKELYRDTHVIISSSYNDIEVELYRASAALVLRQLFNFFALHDPFISDIEIKTHPQKVKGKIETQYRIVEFEFTEVDQRRSKFHVWEKYSRVGLKREVENAEAQ